MPRIYNLALKEELTKYNGINFDLLILQHFDIYLTQPYIKLYDFKIIKHHYHYIKKTCNCEKLHKIYDVVIKLLAIESIFIHIVIKFLCKI